MENQSRFVVYRMNNGQANLKVRVVNETVWLSQKQLASLLQTSSSNIAGHLSNIYREEELNKALTIMSLAVVQAEGKRRVKRQLKHYNLDAIISLGYRVNRHKVTDFRVWAAQQLRVHIVKGFILDDTPLKQSNQPFDYFVELARRIEDIRLSEKRCYQKITDLYATSVDYDPTSALSIEFFRTIQNKLYWGVTSQTAAEIVRQRANCNEKNMGLTNWANKDHGKAIHKSDALIAKNYLTKAELLALNNLTEQYLAFAQGQALRHIPMTMNDWTQKLDGFLRLNDRNVLDHKGLITPESAKSHAKDEYEQFKRTLNIQGMATLAIDDSSRLQNIMH